MECKKENSRRKDAVGKLEERIPFLRTEFRREREQNWLNRSENKQSGEVKSRYGRHIPLLEGRKEEWLSGEITIPIEAKPKESAKAASRQFSTARSCCSFRQITLASGLTIKPQMECVNRLSTGWFFAGSPTPIACNRKQNRFVKGKSNYAFARIQRFWYFSNDRLIENVRPEKVGSNFRSRFVAAKHRS